MARVVAVAGPSGAGKSSLISALCARLPNAVELRFDDYFVLERIGRLVDGFVDRHRDIYRVVQSRVLADCDLVVDGERPAAELADAVIRWLA